MSKNIKIQILRALAIIAVVIIHTNLGGIFGVFDRPFLNFAVALFIFLSGYLTSININDVSKFYRKRISKVLIPYVIWSIIYTIASGNLSNLINNILTAKASIPLYYIFVYIQLVLLTPLISKLIQSKFILLGWFITPISVILIRYVSVYMGVTLGFPFPGTLCVVWFIYYYFGMLLGNNVLCYSLSLKKTIYLYFVSIIISIIEGYMWFINGNMDMATTQIRLTSIFTSLMTLSLAYIFIVNKTFIIKDSKMNKILILIGDLSFGIYFCHCLIIQILSLSPTFSLLPFPLTSIIVLIVSILCVLIGKRILGKKYSILLGL